MCGITGAIWTSRGKPLTAVELDRMVASITHRGPDDSGTYWSDPAGGEAPRVALGFRRLSIIDLAGGHQPMTDHAGRVTIVFNGEIYNYRELREELRGRGSQFTTNSDTEVILEAYKAFGTDCLQRLRGMFALAIWDGARLLLARDRMGQKPLFYRNEQDRLLFGSELKTLVAVDGAPRELNAVALDDYLTYQYVPYPHCIYDGYSKLPPGHAAIYEAEQLQVFRYWSPPYSLVASDNVASGNEEFPRTYDPAELARWPRERWREELRSRLTEAVRLRLRSDVPLGAFLSGGIDSTIIVGLMQQILREQGDRRAMTFSIGFDEAAFDERHFARMAAESLGSEHHERNVRPDALEILPKLVWHYDEPFADSSAIPTMILSQFTREHVTVALTGDGGDELFCGYERYQAVRLAGQIAALPAPLRGAISSPLWKYLPGRGTQRSFTRRLKRFTEVLRDPPERQYLRWVGTFDAASRLELYTPEFQEQLAGHDSFDFLAQAYAACPDRDFVTRTTCADVLTYLPCDILTKVDIASMAASLEARSPFMDHHVVELAARMPIAWKQSRGQGKRILIETFADLIPEAIQTRRKMGFGVPIGPWFRDELHDFVRETLLSQQLLDRGIYRRTALEGMLDDHRSGRWDHGYRIWTLLIGELWMRQWLT